jgi:predicted HTH domain antitoxin
MEHEEKAAPTQAEIDEESRRGRRLRLAVQLAIELIHGGTLSYEEAVQLMAATRRLALQLFPGKGETFDLIYARRLERSLRSAYRIN